MWQEWKRRGGKGKRACWENILEQLSEWTDLGNKHHQMYAQESGALVGAESLPTFAQDPWSIIYTETCSRGLPSWGCCTGTSLQSAGGNQAPPFQRVSWASTHPTIPTRRLGEASQKGQHFSASQEEEEEVVRNRMGMWMDFCSGAIRGVGGLLSSHCILT